jgi:hypothetical protein
MGSMRPVPVEEDMPGLMKKPGAMVKMRHVINYGNWRWHVENIGAGHAQMVHRDTMRSWFIRPFPGRIPGIPEIKTDADGTGVEANNALPRKGNQNGTFDPADKRKLPPLAAKYPGLGAWYNPPKWRRVLFSYWLRKPRGFRFGEPVQGVAISGRQFLPGYYRQPHHPSLGNSYYEWYPPVNEDHYIYSQITVLFPTNAIDRLWKNIWYYIWGKPTGIVLFNNQDALFTKQTTNFTKRHGINIYPMTKASANDDLHTLWRQYVQDYARGVGKKWLEEHAQAPASARKPAEPTPAG